MTATASRNSALQTNKAAAGPPKKSRKKLFAILAVLILLVGGFEAKKVLLAPHYKPGQPVPLGKILPLDQVTVNLADGHLVQASISLQLTSVANESALNSEIPRFDDAVITILGSQTYSVLLTESARAAVKAKILAACQKIAGTVDGAAQQVVAVYFTGFLEQ
jgi:flagellar FliL protein